MGRQFRAPRAGNIEKFVGPTVTAASSTIIAIPNYGVTNVSTFATGDYVLDAPEEGVKKTLFCVSSTSIPVIVRLSTGASVKAGHTAATQIILGLTTIDSAIELVGVNSTRWAILSMTATSTVPSWTGSTVASVTFGTS
jgi:hypothetical protein